MPFSSTSMTLTRTSSPTLSTSSTFSTRPLATREMWQQAVFAGQQLDEGAEGLDAHDATGVLLPHLGDLDDGL